MPLADLRLGKNISTNLILYDRHGLGACNAVKSDQNNVSLGKMKKSFPLCSGESPFR
jgi:hypothetical protein